MSTTAGNNYVSKSPWFLTMNPDNMEKGSKATWN